MNNTLTLNFQTHLSLINKLFNKMKIDSKIISLFENIDETDEKFEKIWNSFEEIIKRCIPELKFLNYLIALKLTSYLTRNKLVLKEEAFEKACDQILKYWLKYNLSINSIIEVLIEMKEINFNVIEDLIIENHLKKYIVSREINNYQQSFFMELHFENGFGASIVRKPGTYGYEDGLFELGVLKKDSNTEKWKLCYNTKITDDVIGWLNNKEINNYLNKIKHLLYERKVNQC